ncbi:MAG: 6-phosphogluconolactonase [Actinomycetota bacterium]|nr:6-phosphogluconolactonase [Actinomycetota bacterium]
MTPDLPAKGEVRVVDDVAAAFATVLAEEAPAVVALSGGGTARHCYQAVADGSLGGTQVVFGDERWVPVEDDESNEGMARRVLLDRARSGEVHSLRGAGATREEAAGAYDQLVASLSSLGLVHLGLGPDGHTASLFPGAAALEVDDRLVVPTGDHAHPHPRLSLTFAGIARADLVVFTVAGEDKADAWRRLRSGEDLPASRVRAPRVLWLVDPAAAGNAG